MFVVVLFAAYVLVVFALNFQWVRSIYFWLLLVIALHSISIIYRFLRREKFGFWVTSFDHNGGDVSIFFRWLVMLLNFSYLILLPIIMDDFNEILASK